MQSIETLKTKKKVTTLHIFNKKLGAHALNDLRFHGNDKFWDICQNCHSCHLALRPEITIFQRPLLWHSAVPALRVNEICCCTSLTLLFVCYYYAFGLLLVKYARSWLRKLTFEILIRDPVSPKQNFLCKSIVLNEYKKMVLFSPFKSYTIRECIDILWV